ncbi:hypothetical protein VC83_07811 [Pseudogymnoascus destructans]|uniref:Proteophosphoglycan 5 n=2 Tax=Pseudogymnoascus destructans TaxID=655981 RepID=L8FNZ5_PSED2|nr:uncharacterized protein VC83_07811 [Pseudogymnoascus destructans]ELR02178.1 hypothetical protein GMDG_00971 [Pseudogymnoascus destructans 20631-21]OAF55841.1 hypothetical protein VC83_07811 [Pseudogymnoascus destructans]
MSSLTPQMARRHRHNQSADVSSSGEAPRNPQNPRFYNNQVHADNSRSSTNYGQPTTPPRTPQKAPNGKFDKTPGANMGPGNCAKNAAVTFAAAKAKPNQPSGHPSVSKPISTPNAAAYAGPTFHASPAPSALPMPSFFSKSVPESPSIKISDSRADETNSSSSDSSPPPIVKACIAEQRQKKSPLDFFFNADREEKARARSANSAVAPFQPPAGLPPNDYRTPAANNQGRNNNPKFAGGSASSMFAMELDGTPGKPYGPAFSTPYSERINAARSTPSLVNSPSASASDQQKTTDRSEALKSFLFSGQKPAYANANGRAPEPPFPGQQSPTPNRAALQLTSPSGPRTKSYSSPQQHRQNGFPYINDRSGYGSATRNTSRTSGLRQEVTPTKTPPERMDNSTFQNSPSYNFKENSARRQIAGSNLASNNQAPPPIAATSPSVSTLSSHINYSDIRTMEDSLRRILKLEPSVSGSGVSDSGIPVASASSPHY